MKLRRFSTLLLCAATVMAQANNAEQGEPTHRPSIGLALGGGGALALSEIGVLRWFEENHIPVDAIAGTSMGSMIGAFYATGKTPDEIEHLMNDQAITQVFRLNPDFRALSYRRREDRRWAPNALNVGLRHGVSLRSGVLIDSGLNSFLSQNFLAYGSDLPFSNLPIPFRCVATDIAEGKEAIFRDGSLVDSVRASISLPGIYSPAEQGEHLYVDGAILENLPTGTLRSELHPDVVIGVSLPLAPMEKGQGNSILGVLQRSFSVASWGNELRSRTLADLVLQPETTGMDTGSYTKTKELVAAGYASAEKQRSALLRYRLDDAEWAAYLAHRHSLLRPAPRLLAGATVTAPSPALRRAVEKSLVPITHQPLDLKKVEDKMDDIRSDGRYDADYAVVVKPSGSAQTAQEAQLNVDVKDKSAGPPFLLLGADLAAQSGVPARATLDTAFLYQDFGGFGSEFRARVSAGFQTTVGTEYYRRITTAGFFVAPHFDFNRMPVYIYSDQDRVAQRLSQSAGGGVDGGFTFKRSSELRVGWQERFQRWKTDTGTDGQADFSGTSQWAGVRYRIDDQDRALIATHGLRAQASAGYLYSTVNSRNAPKVDFAGSYAFTAGKGHLFSMGLEAGSLFGRNVSDPFRYTLGGPSRLSASAMDEYRGTDYFLIRPAYLHRIASLPAPLGQSIYVLAMYEAGQMRAPNFNTVTRQDGYLGLAAETPLGVLTLGPSIGDDGHRKFIFTLGRFF
ncbi:patatin-like phospholipase family protein [Terriglobus saanensis]|uniref:patatin-like phospholipase family protein n=1 Tax=Terriglobus saanensis TaxID=870903 RepID=UPI0002D344AB|nr:patatin-like phospholipase family protein [Terriglobus saanensis]